MSINTFNPVLLLFTMFFYFSIITGVFSSLELWSPWPFLFIVSCWGAFFWWFGPLLAWWERVRKQHGHFGEWWQDPGPETGRDNWGFVGYEGRFSCKRRRWIRENEVIT